MIEEVRLMHVMHWQHSFCRILSSCTYLAMVCVVIGACAINGLRASVLPFISEFFAQIPTRVVKSASNSSFMSYQSAPESDRFV